MKTVFFVIPKLSLVLTRSTFSRLFFIVKLLYFFLSRKLIGINSEFVLKCVFLNKKFVLYLKQIVDLDTLKDIYVDEAYLLDLPNPPKYIIDLGAHFGDSTLYFHAMYPDAIILAVEPSPESFKRLLKSVAAIPNIKPINAAVGPYDGHVEFSLMPNSTGDSLVKRKGAVSVVNVRQTTLAKLLHEHDIKSVDLIKFDIEGGEFTVFNDLHTVRLSSAYIGELHFDLTDIDNKTFDLFFAGYRCQYLATNNPRRFIFSART
jgi:FkbM family methyltransferase